MKVVRIARGLGFENVGDIPDEMFPYISQMPVVTESEVRISVSGENLQNAKEIIMRFIESRGNRFLISDLVDSLIFSEPIVEQPAEVVDVEEEYEEEDLNYDYEIVEVQRTTELEDVSDEEKAKIIASEMKSSITTDAKELEQKRITFNKRWTELMHLKREIDLATANIMETPDIKSIITQAKELEQNENKVESVRFSDGGIIVRTKPLVTDNEIGGERRMIGRMEFCISMSPLVSSMVAVNRNPISIKNLDRRVAYGNGEYECGHVESGSTPCWGTAFSQLFNAYTNKDLHAIVEVLIRYVCNPVESDELGVHAIGFPEYHEHGGLVNAAG